MIVFAIFDRDPIGFAVFMPGGFRGYALESSGIKDSAGLAYAYAWRPSLRRSNRSSSLISRILPAWTPGAMAFGPVTLAAFLCPAHAVAIPAQVVLAGMSFMLPVIPVVCLLLVWIYALVARHRRLKGFMARIPGALFLVLLTIIAFTFFVKLSSSVGGLIDPAAEAKLVDFYY